MCIVYGVFTIKKKKKGVKKILNYTVPKYKDCRILTEDEKFLRIFSDGPK